MPQSTRKNRNDTNPPAIQPLDFSAAAGVTAFPADHNDQFSMNNSGYAGFGNAFTNPFHGSRTNASHHQSSTFNTNPFGMSGFGMTGPYTNYPSYGMNMNQTQMKRSHSDNTHNTHAHHNTHDHFGAVTTFSSDPSISFISQTATNANPYSQANNYDLTSLTGTSHKRNYDAFTNNNTSHSSSDLFGSNNARHRHTSHTQNTDLSVLSYGTHSTHTSNDSANSKYRNQKTNATNAFTSPNLLSHNNANRHTNMLQTQSNQTQNHSNNAHIFGRYYNQTNNANVNANKSYQFDANGNVIYNANTNTNANTAQLPYKHTKKTQSQSHTSHTSNSNASIADRTKSRSTLSAHGGRDKLAKFNKRLNSYSQNRKRNVSSSNNRGNNSNNKYDSSGFFPLNGVHKARDKSSVTGVARLSLQHNPPVNGCSIEPYVILSCENGGFMQSDDKDCKFTWYKSKKRLCFADRCSKPATLQCLSCSKMDIENDSSYYCGTQCMSAMWGKHKEMHSIDLNKEIKNVWNNDDDVTRLTNEWKVKNAKECATFKEDKTDLYCKFPPPITNKWTKISGVKSRSYKPTADDIGRQLLLECTPTPSLLKLTESKKSTDKKSTEEKKSSKDKKKEKNIISFAECQDTSPCLPRPDMSHTRDIRYYHSEHPKDTSKSVSQNGLTFRVLSYNCLAPIYCTRSMYPYVEPFKLEWDYRKYNILREILRYRPDIICLQEVQRNHFDAYFSAELNAEGYEGMYRPKTRGNAKSGTVDGCAIFFKRERYKVSSRYHIDFNDTSSIYLDILRNKANEANKPMSDDQNKLMSKRLAKGNIALIVVLEEKDTVTKESKTDSKDLKKSDDKKESSDDHKSNNESKSINISDHTNINNISTIKKQICIANTHVYWDPQFTDVKIWQAWILCEEISRALGRKLPLILCGDFNSEPKSAVYEYLTKGEVDSQTYTQLIKEYEREKRCILPPRDNLRHRLGLRSHYSHNGREPNYTNYTRHYKGTLDYVLYSAKSIEAIGYLQELAESELSKEEAFPNSRNSSDHIPLMGTFAFRTDYQQWLSERRRQRQSHSHSHSHSHRQSSQHSHSHSHSHSRHSSHLGQGQRQGSHSSHRSSHNSQRQSRERSHSHTSNGTEAKTDSVNLRPSAPPRHRTATTESAIPQPTVISKSKSHTLSSHTHTHTPINKRHNSIEILNNNQTNSANANRSNSNNAIARPTTSTNASIRDEIMMREIAEIVQGSDNNNETYESQNTVRNQPINNSNEDYFINQSYNNNNKLTAGAYQQTAFALPLQILIEENLRYQMERKQQELQVNTPIKSINKTEAIDDDYKAQPLGITHTQSNVQNIKKINRND